MVRHATEYDIPQIVTLAEKFYKDYISSYNLGFNKEDFEKTCAFFIENPLTTILVYEYENKIVSSLAGVISPWLSDFSKILVSEQWWYTYEEFRSKIRSYSLVEFLSTWGKEKGATHMIFVSLNSENLENFYSRKGFRKTEIHFMKEV